MKKETRLWWILGIVAPRMLLSSSASWAGKCTGRRRPFPGRRQRRGRGVHRGADPRRPTGLAEHGGQQIGSIWGHGAYQAPDWSADWLHREATALLARWAGASIAPHSMRSPETQARCAGACVRELRTNRFDVGTGDLTISADRAAVVVDVARHYATLFSDDPALRPLRESYAIQAGAIPDADPPATPDAVLLLDGVGCGRPSARARRDVHEQLAARAAHRQRADRRTCSGRWSASSAACAARRLVWWKASATDERRRSLPRAIRSRRSRRRRRCARSRSTSRGRRALRRAGAPRRADGALHGRGAGLFGCRSSMAAVRLTRTWHIQTALFWIATAFLAAGLFLAPAVGGARAALPAPRRERALRRAAARRRRVARRRVARDPPEARARRELLVRPPGLRVRGSRPRLADRALRRAGLWLVLMLRALWPALRRRDAARRWCALHRLRDRDRAYVRRRASSSARARTSGRWSTGGGGSCTSGWRDSSRCSRRRRSRSCSRGSASCSARTPARGDRIDRDLPAAAASPARSITCTSAARRCRSWPSARSSARSRWCRSC